MHLIEARTETIELKRLEKVNAERRKPITVLSALPSQQEARLTIAKLIRYELEQQKR